MSASESLVRRLAARAGVAPTWRDMAGRTRPVSLDTLSALLAALGSPCGDDAEASDSLATLERGAASPAEGRLVVGRAGRPTALPTRGERSPAELRLESGERRLVEAFPGFGGALTLPPVPEPGWHEARVRGECFRLANAPERCPGFRELIGQDRAGWGVAAQVYSLRARVECGAGDLSGVGELAAAAAGLGADLVVISPIHALRGAPARCDSPYSPSSRVFLDPVYADPFPHAPATGRIAELVDWPAARRTKEAALRRAYDALRGQDSPEFDAFAAAASPALRAHATFEAIRDATGAEWDWRDGPHRRPGAPETLVFARQNEAEIGYRLFLQWTAERSLATAQARAKAAGMKIGIVADVPAGVDPAGSDVWADPDLFVHGATLGAPPDFFTVAGQDWRLTTFSPRALAARDFEPFIAMLRANLRHTGGLRLDHVMAVQRLWMIPEGMDPKQGAYVDYPAETLLRLIDLEAWRAGGLIVGEDLGTLPHGFRDYLGVHGVTGMRFLRIERDSRGWRPPDQWTPRAAALSCTHDVIATAGWWNGLDLEGADEAARAQRARDRELLWRAFRDAGVAQGPPPPEGEKAVDAAFAFLGLTPCDVKIVTLEDAFATDVQVNTPGTLAEKPNWRHRFAEPPEEALARPKTAARLAALGGAPALNNGGAG